MPRWHFRLESVLDYRSQVVEQRQQELADLERVRFREQAELDRLRGRIRQLQDAIKHSQEAGILDCADLLLQFQQLEQQRERAEQQVARVAEVALRVAAQRDQLLLAVRDKQVLEKLKEHQLDQSKQEVTHKEGQVLDEMGVIRFYRNMRDVQEALDAQETREDREQGPR